jgi:hypothetical protein
MRRSPRHWEHECKKKKEDKKEDNIIVNVVKNEKYSINVGLVTNAL